MATPPYRQIRALYDSEIVTVYQAYSVDIASAAVKAQKLSASSDFKPTRMTWIKPSWCWMMYFSPSIPFVLTAHILIRYRSGYSYKDSRQARILALRMKHANFRSLLATATLSHGSDSETAEHDQARVQWDPERGPRLERLEWRSIQIGVPIGLVNVWVEEWIEGIEDVTHVAREMKDALDADPTLGEEDLVARGLIPIERDYQVPEELRRHLGMDI